MKISPAFLKIFLLVAVCLSVYSAEAQTTRNFAVMLRADISQAPDITISWEADPDALSYQVYRRLNPTDSWVLKKTLFGKETSFTDTTTVKGIAYEYQVLKTAQLIAEKYLASGYIYAGSDVYPAIDARKALLLIDETFKTSLAAEIMQFENDLKSEGWQVVKEYVPRTETFDGGAVTGTKEIILAENSKEPGLLKNVILIGRIAVPYSGDIFPDGHQPDHRGAWPADGYYGDVQEPLWSDNSVEVIGANRQENKNIQGDGKFDPSNFPSALEFSVGRIDLSNMTDFKKTELELLKAYFGRNHDFRTGKLNIPQRGIVDDNFGSFINRSPSGAPDTTRYIESFATTAWRAWSPLVGAQNIVEGDYLGTLDTAAYLWAYGCGGGSYQSAGGVGVTAQFADSSVNTIFSSVFGSYFGDWDVQNSFLRAPLCSSPGALTSVWAGRPHWFFHRMGLGEAIGQSELLSQNNFGENNGRSYLSTSYFSTKSYPAGIWYSNNSQGTHIALMGDPTLVMQPVARNVNFTSISLTSTGFNRATLVWGATPDTDISGYFVYWSNDSLAEFTPLNVDVIQALSFTDTTAPGGENFYKIVAVKLQTSPSGSYFTPLAVSPIVSVNILSSIAEESSSFKNISIQPNPANEIAEISFKNSAFEKVDIEILDIAGRNVVKLFSGALESNDNSFQWDLLDEKGTRVPAGIYLVKMTSGKHTTTQKIVVMP